MATNCARCGAELQPGATACIACGLPAGRDRLAEFCRSIGCGVRNLLDDPAYQPQYEFEKRLKIAHIRCRGCTAWQYDRYLR